jgi:hypothetical protein
MATKGWSGPPGRRKQVSDLTSRERRRCARNVTVGGSFGASGARLPGTCGCSTPEAAAGASRLLRWSTGSVGSPRWTALWRIRGWAAAGRARPTLVSACAFALSPDSNSAAPYERISGPASGRGSRVWFACEAGRSFAEVRRMVDEAAPRPATVDFRLPSRTSSRARGPGLLVRPPLLNSTRLVGTTLPFATVWDSALSAG